MPDVYRRNQDLSEALERLRKDVAHYKDIASFVSFSNLPTHGVLTLKNLLVYVGKPGERLIGSEKSEISIECITSELFRRRTS